MGVWSRLCNPVSSSEGWNSGISSESDFTPIATGRYHTSAERCNVRLAQGRLPFFSVFPQDRNRLPRIALWGKLVSLTLARSSG